MASVDLSDQEWQHVLAMISEQPWRLANPLIMKIGEQLRKSGNSREVPAPQPHFESSTH